MNGTIAQYVAITCHANAFLKGHKVESLLNNNSTCQFCETISFEKQKVFLGIKKRKNVANNPLEWFHYLKLSNAKGVRLSNHPQNDPKISDRNSSGFVGGGRNWLMEVLLPQNQSEYWLSLWDTGNREHPERRIWKAVYLQVAKDTTSSMGTPDVDQTTHELKIRLQEIHDFDHRYCNNAFGQWFEEALDTIASNGKNFYGYHNDLFPKGAVSEQGATLLNACQKAWVFGGMGSWNDVSFEGDTQKEYERVSDRLFEIVNDAIVIGTNTSFTI